MTTTPATTPPAARRPARPAFTLVEIMISVALVLVIILGVNQVFSLTGQAVGAGQAISTITRAARNGQNIIYGDLSRADFDTTPYFLIRSGTLAAFRNQEDMLGDRDYSAANVSPNDTTAATAAMFDAVDQQIRSVDLLKDGTETLVPRALLSRRNKRVDQISFFSRNNSRRQTGDQTTFTSNVTSNEVYITYGHLRKPNQADDGLEGREPGYFHENAKPFPTIPVLQGPNQNPNNFFASQWVLGRKTMLLRQPDANNQILDQSTGQPLWYYGRSLAANATSRAPFSFNSGATRNGTIDTTQSQQNSYYDLAGITIDRFAGLMPGIISGTAATSYWEDALIFRSTGFPAPTKPLTPVGAARTVPCFLENCTQFAVEFAGDFVTQDADGKVTAFAVPGGGGTDGEIDYCYNKVTGTRQVRWYGYPRDTDGDGQIPTVGTPARPFPSITDTLPLRDVVRSVQPGFAGFLFERHIDDTLNRGTRLGAGPTPPDYAAEAALSRTASYVVGWATDTRDLPRPKMLRITMALDDPQARLSDEQFFEFVIELP